MSGWRKVRLGDVIDIFDHIRVPLSATQRATRKGPYPYYGAQGIIDHLDDYLFDGRYLLIPEDGENLNSRKLPIAYFANGKFWVNNHAHIVRGKSGQANDVFLKHALTVQDISGYVTGAAQPKLNQANLRRIAIALPPLETQHRIASILGAYDDLIEVNRRRVAVLEDMARGLFEEWFVRFRFPGHENVPIVDKPDGPLPEGWSMRMLDELCSRITDGAHRSPPSAEVGKPMASVRDMRDWGFDYSACRTIEDAEWDELVRGDCRPLVGDILIAKDGANLNKHTFLVWREEPVVLLSSIAIIRPARHVQREFLTATLRSSSTDAAIKNMKSGAAIPRIVLKDFKRLPVVWPTSEIRDEFERLAQPLHQQCRFLIESNQHLAASRDLLLPRLISGQLSVETAERQLEDAA